MESLFSLILIGKAGVFVIYMVQIKLSIVLFEIRCCITKDVKFSPQKVESVWQGGVSLKKMKAFNGKFWFNFVLFCFSIALFPMFANFPKNCVSTRQWVFLARILVLFQLSFFLEISFSWFFKFFSKRSTSHW